MPRPAQPPPATPAQLREDLLVMVEASRTPLPFWLEMDVLEYEGWIEAANSISKRKKAEYDRISKGGQT